MREAACRSSQHAMPADTKARNDPGLTNIDPYYRSRRAICNSSFRTLRASNLSGVRPLPRPESSLPIAYARDNSRSGAVHIKTSGHSSKSGIEHSRSTSLGESPMCRPDPDC